MLMYSHPSHADPVDPPTGPVPAALILALLGGQNRVFITSLYYHRHPFSHPHTSNSHRHAQSGSPAAGAITYEWATRSRQIYCPNTQGTTPPRLAGLRGTRLPFSPRTYGRLHSPYRESISSIRQRAGTRHAHEHDNGILYYTSIHPVYIKLNCIPRLDPSALLKVSPEPVRD